MATSDLRIEKKPIGKVEFAALSWTNGNGHAPQSATINNVDMLIERIDLLVSSGGVANPTVTIDSFVDDNSAPIINSTQLTNNFTTLADNTNHVKLSGRATADFDVIPVNGNLTITVDASGEPTAGSTLTVNVILYGP